MRTSKVLIGVSFLALAVLLSNGGCNRYKSKEEPKHDHAAHPETGPHGGPLAELGEEAYHAELVMQKGKDDVTIYILDGDAKNGVPIEQDEIELTIHAEKPPVQVKLKAEPQKGEDKGSSRFVGSHASIGKGVEPAQLEVTVNMKGKGAPLHGKFDHKH